MIFVPGGTDARSLYADTGANKDKAFNLHKEIYELADGLIVAGLGGSTPAYFSGYNLFEDEEGNEVEEEFTDELSSYPYASEDDFKVDLDSLWFDKVKVSLDKQRQVLLLTHEGP